MVEKIVENIYRIPIRLPQNPLKELNAYLIKDEERSLLIDTGFRRDECREDLLGGLAELGEKAEELDIFLTHLHSDHTGLAPDIIGAGRKIYISDVDRRWLEDQEVVDAIWERRAEEFKKSGFPWEILKNMRTTNPAVKYAARPGCKQFCSINDGDVFEKGGYRFRCIMTPGHTPGHMCLWEEEQGILFSGDHVLFDITPNITSWETLEDTLGSYLESLRMVRDLPVKMTLPSHRKTGDFKTRVDELLAHHEERLAEAERIVQENPGLPSYDIAGKMTWSIRAKNWDDFPDGQKFFAVGECISHLEHLEKCGRVRRVVENGLEQYFAVK